MESDFLDSFIDVFKDCHVPQLPMTISYDGGPFHYKFQIPVASSENLGFFQRYLAKRDIQRGVINSVQRTSVSENEFGNNIDFHLSLREGIEAFYGHYSSQRFVPFLEENSVATSERDSILKEFSFADDFWEYAFIVEYHDNRRGNGDWDAFRILMPGLSSNEIDARLPKYLFSQSKYSKDNVPNGLSGLIKRGRDETFWNVVKDRTRAYVSEENYFLAKVASHREASADLDYAGFMRKKGITNVDRAHYNFARNFHKPVILFVADENKLPSINLKDTKIDWGYLSIIYPVFNENFALPDFLGSTGAYIGNDPKVLMQKLKNVSEAYLSGALQFRETFD